jgi:hypothetical protein
MLIQDPSDPLVRIVSFGGRNDFDSGNAGRQFWTHLPSDFGTSGYAARRAREIDRYFREIIEHSDFLETPLT